MNTQLRKSTLIRRSATQHIASLVLFASLTACGSQHDGGTAPDDETHVRITTTVETSDLEAGATTQVWCDVMRNGKHDTLLATNLVASPAEIEIERLTPQTFRVNAKKSGEFSLRCESQAGSAVDALGSKLTVNPGAPSAVDTLLDDDFLVAGDETTARCTVRDAFGNQTASKSPTRLVADEGVAIIDHVSPEMFRIQAMGAGMRSLTCHTGELFDAEPATLLVTPGAPSLIETQVDRTLAGPAERVGVTCAASDLYGNKSLDETDIAVDADDGTRSTHTGLVADAHGFSVTRAGYYKIACRLPAQDIKDPTPIAVVINPGLGFRLDVQSQLEGCHMQGMPLPLSAVATDRYGNVLPNSAVSVAVSPQGSMVLANGESVIVSQEGVHSFLFIIKDEYLDPEAKDFWREFTMLVDSTPPTINITSPRRGDMVMEQGSTQIIEGQITDGASNVVTASINEQPVPTPGNSQGFRIYTQAPRIWGLNLINARATDECGNTSVLNQAYLYSDRYFQNPARDYAQQLAAHPSATPVIRPSSLIPAGARLLLHQDILDDKNPDRDDIKTLGTELARAIDLNSMLPQGTLVISKDGDLNLDGKLDFELCNDGNLRFKLGRAVARRHVGDPQDLIRYRAIRLEDPTLESLTLSQDLVQAKLSVKNVLVPFGMEACLNIGNLGLARIPKYDGGPAQEGSIYIQSMSAEATIRMQVENGKVRVGMRAADVQICRLPAPGEDPNVCRPMTFSLALDYGALNDFGGALDSVMNSAITLLSQEVQAVLRNEVARIMTESLPTMLSTIQVQKMNMADVMGSMIPALQGTSLDMLAGFQLRNIQLSNAANSARNHCAPGLTGAACGANKATMSIDLDAHAAPLAPSEAIGLGVFGSIQRSGSNTTPAVTLLPQQTFALSISDDMLNQALWAFWYGGGLQVNDLYDFSAGVIPDEFRAALQGSHLSAAAHLPPVIMPGRTPDAMQIAIGDLEIRGDVDLGHLLGSAHSNIVHLGMYVSLVAEAKVRLDPATHKLMLEISPDPTIGLEVSELSNRYYQAQATDLLMGFIRKALPEMLGTGLMAVEIPDLDVATMTPIETPLVLRLQEPSIERSAFGILVASGVSAVPSR